MYAVEPFGVAPRQPERHPYQEADVRERRNYMGGFFATDKAGQGRNKLMDASRRQFMHGRCCACAIQQFPTAAPQCQLGFDAIGDELLDQRQSYTFDAADAEVRKHEQHFHLRRVWRHVPMPITQVQARPKCTLRPLKAPM